MLTLIAFVVAIGVLVVVHEWGHYAMAVACGVKVLRFSVGFGPRLWGWTAPRNGTEFVISLLPLGGFVKMLDTREGEVSPADRPLAFDAQSLPRRTAIVLAGPLANLLLAVLLYTLVNWAGMEQPQAVLAKPTQGSVLEAAGFIGGERVLRTAFAGDDLQEVRSFDDFRWWLTRAALEHRVLGVEYTDARGSSGKMAQLPLGTVDASVADARLFKRIGAGGPFSLAQMGEITVGGAAQAAGLRAGDVVLGVDGVAIIDAAQLRELIRASGSSGNSQALNWEIRRDGALQTLVVSPRIETESGAPIGRIGAYIGNPPAMVLVRYGPWEGLERAFGQTADIAWMTLQMMGKIVVGQASVKNLSGPITIADYAGKSAAVGLTQYLMFLALISVSLGVLNLLPVPMLDGGHLM
ncbi:MAG: RIP metalloprotease RseP, partial [Rhodoferax sp.]